MNGMFIDFALPMWYTMYIKQTVFGGETHDHLHRHSSMQGMTDCMEKEFRHALPRS